MIENALELAGGLGGLTCREVRESANVDGVQAAEACRFEEFGATSPSTQSDRLPATAAGRSQFVDFKYGEMSEWLKEHAWK